MHGLLDSMPILYQSAQHTNDININNSSLSDFNFNFSQSWQKLILKRCLTLLIVLTAGGLGSYFFIAPFLAKKVDGVVGSEVNATTQSLDDIIITQGCNEAHKTIGLNISYCAHILEPFVTNLTDSLRANIEEKISNQTDRIHMAIFLLSYTSFVIGAVTHYIIYKPVNASVDTLTHCYQHYRTDNTSATASYQTIPDRTAINSL